MSKIKQMDEALANRIAAGEVVERPAGVIKELLENSIDAAAKSITVEVTLGGLEKIVVTDDGEGMDEVDLVNAFGRHSTSKIQSLQDLDAISTLGFRGEALPSIASVSYVRAHSRHHQIVIDNGKQLEFLPSSFNHGFSIEVSNLFYKTPARLKHLKAPSYEMSLVTNLLTQFALGYPQIAFTLISDGQVVFQTAGNGQLIDVLYQKFGYDVAHLGVPFQRQNDDFKISGIYVSPHIHRGNKRQIYLYLNHRMIRYTKVTNTIVDIFHHYMPVDRYPIVVLNIESDAYLVDVNVHPNKWEVRLSKENKLIELMDATFRELLGQNTQVKEINPTVFEKPMFINFDQIETVSSEPIVETPVLKVAETNVDYTPLVEDMNPIRVIGQHHGNYILAQDESSLYIFDQHASMERVNYEKVLKQFNSQTFSQQQVLTPYVFKCSTDVSVLKEHFGLCFETFSLDSVILRSVPTWLVDLDVQNVVQSILDLVSDEKTQLEASVVLKKKIATIACHQSIRFNQSLTGYQLQHIVDEVLKCDNPYHCPHGRPTYVKVDAKDLLKEFAR